jgi:tetratricopeptide (TPR) repeat protein
MKRIILRGLLLCVFAFAAAGGMPADTVTRTEHFEVVSDGDDAGLIAREMEERFAVYDRLIRFDPAVLSGPLRVRAFGKKEAYNAYVASRLGSEAPGAVYLHYGEAGQRELVISRGAEDALSYQSFLQFFRAFVPQPPAWMKEGLAVYFSGLTRNDEGELSLRENLDWLETVKTLTNPPSPEAILLADTGERPEPFPALAWSLVSFFLNSGKEEYARSLTDSFMVLSAGSTAAENAGAVMKRIARWNNMENLAADYRRYLESRKTLVELIAEGQRAYAGGDMAGAEAAFRAVLERKTDHYVPYYYLGLIAYNAKNYSLAEEHYFSSLGYGAENAIVFYALGLNAAAAGSNAEAADYLRQAAEIAPDRYREKAEKLIARLLN